jgi:hypothetical protein
VDLSMRRLLGLLILGGRQRQSTRVMGCNYCGGSIMGTVVVEEGAGGQQSSKLWFGRFFLILFNSYVKCSFEPCMYVGNTKFDLTP